MTPRQSRGPHVFRIVPLAVAFFALVACDQGNGRTADGDLKVMVTVSEELASSVGSATEAYEEAIEEAVRVMEANLAKTSHARRVSLKLRSLNSSQTHQRMLRPPRLAWRHAALLAELAATSMASGQWALTVSPSFDFGPRSRRPSSDRPLRPRL